MIIINPNTLKKQVEEGWKLKALAEHYDLPVSQMKKALKMQNLNIRKLHAPKFSFLENEQDSYSNDTYIENKETQ